MVRRLHNQINVVREPLHTSVVDKPTPRKTLEKFRKSMGSSFHMYEVQKRSKQTGRTENGRESIPVQTDVRGFPPPSPSPGVESINRNSVESCITNSDDSGNGNVAMEASRIGKELRTTGAQPQASSIIVPRGSAGTHPLKLEVSRERPPRFSGSK